MRTNSAPTSKTKVAVGRVANKAAAGSRSGSTARPGRSAARTTGRTAEAGSRRSAGSTLTTIVRPSPAVPGAFFKIASAEEDNRAKAEVATMGIERSKSDNLKKVRQRTDQMMKRQAAQKELQEKEEKRN